MFGSLAATLAPPEVVAAEEGCELELPLPELPVPELPELPEGCELELPVPEFPVFPVPEPETELCEGSSPLKGPVGVAGWLVAGDPSPPPGALALGDPRPSDPVPLEPVPESESPELHSESTWEIAPDS